VVKKKGRNKRKQQRGSSRKKPSSREFVEQGNDGRGARRWTTKGEQSFMPTRTRHAPYGGSEKRGEPCATGSPFMRKSTSMSRERGKGRRAVKMKRQSNDEKGHFLKNKREERKTNYYTLRRMKPKFVGQGGKRGSSDACRHEKMKKRINAHDANSDWR